MEMSRDLLNRGVNVVVFSLLPGLVKTESVIAALSSGRASPTLVNAVNAGLGMSSLHLEFIFLILILVGIRRHLSIYGFFLQLLFNWNTSQPRKAFSKQSYHCFSGVSLELPGRLVASMVKQPRYALLKQSGRCLFLADLARKFGLKDIDKKYPTHPRSVKTLLKLAGWKRLAFFVPPFIKIPCWVLSLATSKF